MATSRWLLLSVLTTMGVFGAFQSQADTPLIVRQVNEFDLRIVDCTDFEVRTKGVETDTFKFFSDRVVWKILVTESVYYNSSNPDKFIQQGQRGVGENQTRTYYFNGDMKEVGGAFRITIPKVGHVLMYSGYGYWDASENSWVHHGLEWAFAEGETGLALCEALE